MNRGVMSLINISGHHWLAGALAVVAIFCVGMAIHEWWTHR